MNTLTVRIESTEDLIRAATEAARRAERGETFEVPSVYSFSSWERLHDVLNVGRMGLLMAMAGKGPMRTREVAKLVGRDLKNVHGDLTRLAKNGLIDKTAEGFVFPYDHIRLDVEFDMSKAA